MKKGTLNFLGRKNQSLFDTNVKMKDMDNVDLVLGSGTILESGTASVRARPTVKHYSSSSDSFHAYAVPTPTVPHYAPAINGTKINGSVSDDQSSNGSTISVTDPIEGEIFVPPPPSMAPPPPPAEVFVLPPPEFMGDLSTLQTPVMPASKPPSQFLSLQEDDFNFLTPPPMSPPKPPSTGSNGSSVPISSPVATKVPEHPKYAPPQPPAEKIRSFKTPPPKPIRISSVQNLDTPLDTSTPPPPAHTPTPPVHTPTRSSFNPQSPAKLYNAPKSSFVNGYEESGPKIQPKLLFEDAGTGPVVQNDTKQPKSPQITQPQMTNPQITPRQIPKPQIPKPHIPKPQSPPPQIPKPQFTPLQITNPQITPPQMTKPQSTPPQMTKPQSTPPQTTAPPSSSPPQPAPERKPLTAASLKEIHKTPKTPPVQKVTTLKDIKPEKLDKPDGSPPLNGKYSPLIDRKLRNISGPSAPKDTSPLALLMAAKQRDKQRPTTHETRASNQNSLLSTNSGSTLSLNSMEGQSESPKSEPIYAIPNKQPKEVNPVLPSASLLPSKTVQPVSSSVTTSDLPKIDIITEPDLDAPFLPPPPEFDDLDEIEPPPTMRPPDPPKMAALSLTPVPPPTPPKLPAQTTVATPVIPTPPKPAPAPPPAPQLPPPTLDTTVKSKPPAVLAKPKPTQAPLPTPATPSQATLLNILKKKMMEMDQKIGPDASEHESNSDDWGSPEDNEVPVMPKVNTPKNAGVRKSATLDMRELQTKMAQKNQEPNRIPIPTSNGPSRHQYGMTFTVRPGTKQPITLVNKGE